MTVSFLNFYCSAIKVKGCSLCLKAVICSLTLTFFACSQEELFWKSPYAQMQNTKDEWWDFCRCHQDTTWSLNLRSEFTLTVIFLYTFSPFPHTHLNMHVCNMTHWKKHQLLLNSNVPLSSLWADVILVSEPVLYVLITAVPRAQTYSSPALFENFFNFTVSL